MRRTAAEASITRHTILQAARHSFETVGYAASSLDGVAAAAKVTRGAVHHHFGNKEGLFREVFVELTRAVETAAFETAKQAESPWQGFANGVHALLQVMCTPGYVRVVMVDAPSVIGFDEWHAINRAAGMKSIGVALAALTRDGTLAIEPNQLPVVTTLLYGALIEAGLSAARAEDLSLDHVHQAFLALVNRYRAPSTGD
jgi:AcrR family transcriptional regulator